MPQSLSKVIIHVVFSTQYRLPWIKEPIKEKLHAYMATTIRNFEGNECYRAGGVADHVHLAVRLSRTTPIASLVQRVKTSSSRWMKEQDDNLQQFAWQGGYGAFSVYYKEVDQLLQYIDNQEEHHRKKTFKDEYRGFLEEHGIEYDERYVWD